MMITDEEIYCLGIDLGLGMLFNENKLAIDAWLDERREQFDGECARDLMERCNFEPVKDLLELAMNLR